MEHIGIDLGANHSHVVVMTGQGEVVTRRKVPTNQLGSWMALRPPGRVVMEACTQSVAVARLLGAGKHTPIVVPGSLVRTLGVGARGIKTDDRDAEILALASVRVATLPSVHLPSEQAQSRRELVAARSLLVKARSTIALSVKSSLRGQLVTLRGRASSKHFAATVRSLVVEQASGLSMAMEALLASYEALCDQIDALDEQVKAIVESDSVCTRLRTIPGVGAQVSLAFTAQLDDVERFRSSAELASYLALVPGEQTTGGKVKRTGTIKAGPRYLKALLVQAAWSMWRSHPSDPAVAWARAIADKRGRRIAIIALARKIATVMWSMWKHGTTYEPMRAARTIEPG